MLEKIRKLFRKDKEVLEIQEKPKVDVRMQAKYDFHTRFTNELKTAYQLNVSEETAELFMNSIYISQYRHDGKKAINSLEKDKILMMKYLPAVISSEYAMALDSEELDVLVSKTAKATIEAMNNTSRNVRISKKLLSEIENDPSKYIEISQTYFAVEK